ncbi:MAG: thioredoxin [Phycisphaeraceae bacterium]|nr:thioredoxin [Phycisphaeraceae bacterium]
MSSTFEITDANFRQEVLEPDQPVLVDFWATWCPPCRAVAPTIDEIARQYEGVIRVGKLDVDNNPQTAAAYGISSIPTFLLFRDGEVIEKFSGLRSKEAFEQIIEKHLATV